MPMYISISYEISIFSYTTNVYKEKIEKYVLG
jgi:hypothetical protein